MAVALEKESANPAAPPTLALPASSTLQMSQEVAVAGKSEKQLAQQ